MIQVQSQNNNGLFRPKTYSISRKKKYNRLFIRRSKIYPSITNNSFSQSYPHENDFTIHYRPQITQLRHRRIRRKILNGAGDEKIINPSISIKQKHIDFTELEQIFDNAIRNRLLHKEKLPTNDLVLTQHENPHQQSIPELETNPIDTRINLSTVEPIEEIQCCFIYNIKQHKIFAAIIFVTLSAVIGFFSVFIFVK